MRISSIMASIWALFCCFTAGAQDIDHPKYEVRAVWLTTIGGLDWPHTYSQSSASTIKQQRELTDILDQLQRANINTILLQTRIRATTIYPSKYEPWDGCISGHPGKSPGYDPLAFAIKECHKRGMELHAWVVTIPVGKWDKLGCRTLNSRKKGIARRIGADGYMKPEDPRTANYLADICEEITSKYDIDGIHLDYIRYPEQVAIPRQKLSSARNNITRIVKTITHRVKAIKPWVKMSCSPVGKFDDLSRYSSHGWNAYTKVAQDAQGWLKDGLMDQLYPMMYFKDNQFFPFALDWQENSHGKTIGAGLGIYFLSPREGKWTLDMIQRQLYFLRSEGIGHAFFRCKFLLDNTKGIYDFVCNEYNRYPAQIPPMKWSRQPSPAPPQDVRLTTDEYNQEWLEWSAANNDDSEGKYTFYNIYKSSDLPVDTSDPRLLVVSRTADTRIPLPCESRLFETHYAVTAIDRYGYESLPIYITREGTWKR